MGYLILSRVELDRTTSTGPRILAFHRATWRVATLWSKCAWERDHERWLWQCETAEGLCVGSLAVWNRVGRWSFVTILVTNFEVRVFLWSFNLWINLALYGSLQKKWKGRCVDHFDPSVVQDTVGIMMGLRSSVPVTVEERSKVVIVAHFADFNLRRGRFRHSNGLWQVETAVTTTHWMSGFLTFSGRWFQIFSIFIPTWGNDPIWLIFVKGVETTN